MGVLNDIIVQLGPQKGPKLFCNALYALSGSEKYTFPPEMEQFRSWMVEEEVTTKIRFDMASNYLQAASSLAYRYLRARSKR